MTFRSHSEKGVECHLLWSFSEVDCYVFKIVYRIYFVSFYILIISDNILQDAN